MLRCSIIIPVYNNASLTRQCVDTLLSQTPLSGGSEVIVVDDASTDVTQVVLSEYGDQIRTVTHMTNRGFSTACNDGAALSRSKYLLFLNNDTIPQPGWLHALVDYADNHPEAAAVGSKLLFPNNTIQHAGVVICQDRYPRHIYAGFPVDHPAVNKSRRFQIVTAGCVLIRRELFDQLDGFDPAFQNGYEDVDFCLRLGQQGYEVHYCHQSSLYHLESVSRKGRDSNFKKNLELYEKRWINQVQADDLSYYIEDDLLKIEYWEMYPIHLTIAPLLAAVPGLERERQVDQLLKVYSREVFEFMKDNARLRLRAQEAALKQPGSGSSDAELVRQFDEDTEIIRARDETIARLHNELSALREGSRQSEDLKLRAAIAKLQDELSAAREESRQAVAGRGSVIRARDEAITSLQDELSAAREESRQAVAGRESVIRVRDEAITSLQEVLAESDKNNRQLSAQLSTKARELEQINHSLGWQLLRRYGKLKYRFLLPVYRMLGLWPYSRNAREDESRTEPHR